MGNKLLDLQRRELAAVAAARRIQEAADAAERALTTEEDGEVRSLLALARDTHAQLHALDPSEGRGGPPAALPRDAGTPAAALRDLADSAQARPAKGSRFADLFPQANLATDGWDSFEQYARTIAMGLSDPRLRLSATMGGSVGGDGGFLVPPGFLATYLDQSLEGEVVRPRATVFPMATDNLLVAGFDGSNNSSTVYGFATEWLGEGATASRSTGKVRAVELHAQKLALYVAASNELLADGQGFEAQLGQRMSEALSFGLDDAFISGDGAGRPLGILKAPCTISVDKETGQRASTVYTENIIKMWSRLLPRSATNAVWVCHPSTLPSLLTLSVGVGAGGFLFPLARTDGNNVMTILGRPVVISEKCATVGTVGDIMLCDFSFYGVGLRADVVLEKSNAPGWLQDQTDFRVKLRVDGKPLLASAYTPKNGSTLSPFITLATRA